MPVKMNVIEAVGWIEELAKQRASKSNDIVEDGRAPVDTFAHEDISIHDPWKSSCGRFEVDPYTTYGKEFVLWMLRPFYSGEFSDG